MIMIVLDLLLVNHMPMNLQQMRVLVSMNLKKFLFLQKHVNVMF